VERFVERNRWIEPTADNRFRRPNLPDTATARASAATPRAAGQARLARHGSAGLPTPPSCQAARTTHAVHAQPLSRGSSVLRVRHHDRVELLPGLSVDDGFLAVFARTHGIRRIALFGSALRDDFRPDSDIDLLVEFQPEHIPGLLHLAQMELELEDALGRPVELRTPEDLSP
jgi:uncharacterized protein